MLDRLYELYSNLSTYIGIKQIPAEYEFDMMEKGIYRVSESSY
jgi:hypothetical protein